MRQLRRMVLGILVVAACTGCGGQPAGQPATAVPPAQPVALEPGKTDSAAATPCQSGSDPLTVLGASLDSPAAPVEAQLGKPVSVETNSKYDDEIHHYSFADIRMSGERKMLRAIGLWDGPGNLAIWPGVTFGSSFAEVRNRLASLGYCPTFSSAQTLRFERGPDLLLLGFAEGRLHDLTLSRGE